MRIGSLFSGYGGLDMATCEAFGAEVAWHVEFDRAPSLILDRHWPDVPNYGDVTQCDWASMPAVDIITGGSPCQDLSAAGRRAGMTEGTRSNLWVHMREAIAIIRPRYVVWENVQGSLSARAASASDMEPGNGPLGNTSGGHLRALGRVLGDLAEIGYDARWTTLRASDIGAPHHRARVFLLATPTDAPGVERERREGGNARGWDAPVGCEASDRTDRPAEDAADGLLPADGRADDLLVLPTPVAHPSGNTPENHLRKKPGRSVVTDLSILVENDLLASGGVVLPTPTVGNATGTNERRGGKRSDELLLPGVAAAHAAGELLPTPTTTQRGTDANADSRPGAGPNLHNAVTVFPTPTTSEATGGKGPNSKRTGGEYLREIVSVLPTPQASDGTSGGATHPDRRVKEGGHGMSIRDYALLAEEPDRWGKYTPAIRRWERLTRPAPAPTELNANGRARLNAAFAEWMMGLPAGWVTDVVLAKSDPRPNKISRSDALKAIGNGVCPQQALAALRLLLDLVEVAA
ncbi:DNA cytosine methyltransferase [Gordonia malaquae]|uniref:DNA cytosine methyltransferase n=1 Tax=Gordonia malaquae TaxID=410332 RepID=UPI0030C79047